MFKKTAIAALVLGVSGAASAAMYGPAPAPACSAGNVTVPCERTAWDLGIQGLYLRTANNVLSDTTNDEFNNDSNWGFRLEGSYHFNTGNDVTINWTYFDNDYGTSGNATYRTANYNVVNLELGQHVDFGENVNIRFHGGLQYASFDQDNGTAPTNQSLQGLGPRVGMNGAYEFGNGFAITGASDMALLAGKSDRTSNTNSTKTVFVNLGQKLGVAYTHAMAQGDLTLDVGYQVNYVFNNMNGNATANSYNSLSYDGLYFGAKWVGNA